LRKYRKNEIIFRQEEVGVGMYIIVKGSVNITTEDSMDHDHILIAKLGPGDFFGELSLVEENGKRSATACAVEETTLIGFFKPDLLEILERNPNAGVKITLRLGEVLGRRLKETNDRVSILEEQLKQYRPETNT
jgi:CRP-like cAMP-binding protein